MSKRFSEAKIKELYREVKEAHMENDLRSDTKRIGELIEEHEQERQQD